MPSLRMQIDRGTDQNFPGWVECSFEDADGNTQTFEEKIPVLSNGNSMDGTALPVTGHVDCERQTVWTDDRGRNLARIDIDRPWGMQSTTGQTQFVVLASQLSE
jgi:hypothetical protein